MTNNKRTSDSSSSGSSISDNSSSNNSSESDESSDYSDDEVKIEKEAKEEQEEFKKISQEIQKSKKKSNLKKEIIKRGVIYLSRIPHGFYEEQMRSYFGQFGTVTNLKLFRNKKTGKSRHFAFIEFESIEVAEIVVETMDNYLLLNHILKCKLIPESQVNPNLWKGTKKNFIPIDYLALAKEKHNRKKTEEEVDKQVERLLNKEEKKRKRLLDLGIDYDFPGYAACVMKKPEHKRFKK